MSYVYFSKKKAIHDAGVFHLKGKHLVANQKNFIKKRFWLAAILFPFQTGNGRGSS